MYYSATTNGFYDPAIHSIIPADAVVITQAEHDALLVNQSSGKSIVPGEDGRPLVADPPQPTTADMQAQYTAAIQKRLDDFARTRNYDGIMSACTYASSAVLQFSAEGQRCLELRDATWTAGYAILADVEAGNRPIPTVEQVLSELPALTWELA